jgi:hypothetical protein
LFVSEGRFARKRASGLHGYIVRDDGLLLELELLELVGLEDLLDLCA